MRKLFIVDPQNDFMDYGTLPVTGSQACMQALAAYLDRLDLDHYTQILISLDWHPLLHCSFEAQGGPWPQHCVAFTEGALVEPTLMKALQRWRMAGKVEFITKGCKLDIDEYSSLDDAANQKCIKKLVKKIDQLDVCGVVGTVCVQNTLKGLLECTSLDEDKIHVLAPFTAQFDVEAEKTFEKWVAKQGCRYMTAERINRHPQYLVFDTETGGLSAENNDILQLSYRILDSVTWETVKVVNHFFPWPEDSWRVSPEAIAVNGLSRRFLAKQKLSDRRKALEQFFDDLSECEGVVAHNISFDYRFVLAEARRAGICGAERGWPTKFDTMKDSRDLYYKYPKLSELAQLLGIDYRGLRLHDSQADVELTAQCFRRLCERGHYKIE